MNCKKIIARVALAVAGAAMVALGNWAPYASETQAATTTTVVVLPATQSPAENNDTGWG